MGAPSATSWVEFAQQRLAAGEALALATVVAIDGSASARLGSKALYDSSGRLVWGWVGGGCAETTVAEFARTALAERRPQRHRLDLDDEVLGVGMPCGGFMEVFVEPLAPDPKLVVLGHGRIAETLAAIGKRLEFHVTVNDALASEEAFPSADERITEDVEYAKLRCDADSYVVITTQHRSDYEALSSVLRQNPAWVGLVASRKRSALVFDRLHQDGIPAQVLRRVSAPAGLDLGAATPQEIALSIFAEIMRVYRGGAGSGRPLAEIKGVRVDDETGVEIP